MLYLYVHVYVLEYVHVYHGIAIVISDALVCARIVEIQCHTGYCMVDSTACTTMVLEYHGTYTCTICPWYEYCHTTMVPYHGTRVRTVHMVPLVSPLHLSACISSRF
jgi:hypothetical protein